MERLLELFLGILNIWIVEKGNQRTAIEKLSTSIVCVFLRERERERESVCKRRCASNGYSLFCSLAEPCHF
ncbi:hypothetical protein GJAV_G00209680 [Gymnothorax javanicus]|nr:hypothetical protein GJAV_G00209680 [Gymnothorax javanicus]